MKKVICFKTLCALVLALAMLIEAESAFAERWSFGVMSDTQWTTTDPAGLNPNSVSVSIIQEINRQFINHGVKFVIEVGDLTDQGTDAGIDSRAAAAQPLIDAGIGFFPMRGNHETYGGDYGPFNNYAIPEFQKKFPQTQGGMFTKSNAHTYKLGMNFSSPKLAGSYPDDLKGMSYSFDYGDHGDNARFLIIDEWVTPNKDVPAAGYDYGYSIADQEPWIDSRLDKKTRGTEHAFVFAHQPLMAESHQDSLFTGYTNANPAMQNAFFASLQNNGVGYYISGHDHMNQRSIIASPDGKSSVQEIIGASDSSKFYTPKPTTDPNWFGQKYRETPISQELYTVGYYIYTVDGPCVTVDYYSDDHGNWGSDNCYANGASPQSCSTSTPGTHITPIFTFVKKATWSYCHNGKQFLVTQGATYTTVQDNFEGTNAQILDGKNNSTAQDYISRAFTKAVNTGWVDVDGWCERYPFDKSNPDFDLASDIFRLSGMADLNSQETDTYVLSLSYNPRLLPKNPGNGLLALAARDKKGRWVNAVDMNFGGANNFVSGPYQSGYGLGTYGFDSTSRTVWAVINYNGYFAVGRFDK